MYVQQQTTTLTHVDGTCNFLSTLAKRALKEDDFYTINGTRKLKRSGYVKLATLLGISISIEEERRVPIGDTFLYEVTVRAILPTKRYASACGVCSSSERKFTHVDHDVKSIATTRAINKAIDLLAGSMVLFLLSQPETAPVKEQHTIVAEEHHEEATVPTTGNVDTSTLFEPISEKQKAFLHTLILKKYSDVPTRERLVAELASYTKQDAHKAIKEMMMNS